VEPLPKTLPGAVCAQWVRCGRRNCRCARGQLHGPYHYHFWRQGGRLRRRYVRPADVPRVRAACQARREEKRQLAQGWACWRELVDSLKEVQP
jgi:hypothetical protein